MQCPGVTGDQVTFLLRDEDDEYKGHSAGLPFNNSSAAIILVGARLNQKSLTGNFHLNPPPLPFRSCTNFSAVFSKPVAATRTRSIIRVHAV